VNHDLLDAKVKASIEQYDIKAKTIACDPELADTAAFCEHYGYDPSQSANTIIVASRTDPAIFVACLVLASTKLDVNKKVRELTGTRKLSFASGEQTKDLTAMLIGGVTVVGLPDNLPIYVDKAVMDCDEILIGGGNRSSKLILQPKQLLKLPNVQVIEGLGLPRE
jgi:prolyl-tRNA editing enzyme YbaK/EbsC (Cys-tRNA(Pro) deacylase)